MDSPAVDPRRVLDRIGIRASRIQRIRRGAPGGNTHWLVGTPDGPVVLRRYTPNRSLGDAAYEVRLLDHLDRRGWPVPIAITPPVESAGSVWCLVRYMPGRVPAPRSVGGIRAEQRRRGRLLAQLHADMASLAEIGQREGWRRADEGLIERTGRPPVNDVLSAFERSSPEEGRILRGYNDRMRERLAGLLPHAPAQIPIHGDLTPWNLRYTRGTLSAVLDFDAAHLDLRVADFALTWRGQYDEVIRGYKEVSPLEPVERELLLPIYWAWVIASAVAGIDAGETNADWAVRHLLRTDATQSERPSSSSLHPPQASSRGG